MINQSRKMKHGWGTAQTGLRHKRKLALVAGCGVLIAAVSTTANSDGAITAAVKDVASMMQARSPGERASGSLTKSKLRQAATGDITDVPSARALAKTRTRLAPAVPEEETAAAEVVSTGPLVIDSPALAEAFASPPVSGAPGAPLFASLPGSGGGGGGGGGFIGIPGGGGGGGGAPGGGTPPDTGSAPPVGATPPPDSAAPPPFVVPPIVVIPPISVAPPGEIIAPLPSPVAAVPEPSTWMTMIFGFGAVGFSLRRNRRKLKRLASVKGVRRA